MSSSRGDAKERNARRSGDGRAMQSKEWRFTSRPQGKCTERQGACAGRYGIAYVEVVGTSPSSQKRNGNLWTRVFFKGIFRLSPLALDSQDR